MSWRCGDRSGCPRDRARRCVDEVRPWIDLASGVEPTASADDLVIRSSPDVHPDLVGVRRALGEEVAHLDRADHRLEQVASARARATAPRVVAAPSARRRSCPASLRPKRSTRITPSLNSRCSSRTQSSKPTSSCGIAVLARREHGDRGRRGRRHRRSRALAKCAEGIEPSCGRSCSCESPWPGSRSW